MTENEFFISLVEKFPELKDKILNDWEDELPHMRMLELVVYSRHLIQDNNHKKFKEIIDYVESKISIAGQELYNTIGVSFVEDLAFDSNEIVRKEFLNIIPEHMNYMYESLKPLRDKKSNR